MCCGHIQITYLVKATVSAGASSSNCYSGHVRQPNGFTHKQREESRSSNAAIRSVLQLQASDFHSIAQRSKILNRDKLSHHIPDVIKTDTSKTIGWAATEKSLHVSSVFFIFVQLLFDQMNLFDCLTCESFRLKIDEPALYLQVKHRHSMLEIRKSHFWLFRQ